MKLTATQSKVYARILEVMENEEDKSITCAHLQSEEFGYKAIRISTMKALVRAGLISVRHIATLEHTTKSYNFGRETVPHQYVDKYFEITLDDKKIFERWISDPWLEHNHIRTEKLCNKTYWVFLG